MKIIHRGTVYPMSIQGRNCHASHCLPLPDGSVLAVWFEGTREGAPDVCIFSARCSPEGVWSAPRRITENNGIPHWNPVLFRRDDGDVLLYYKEGTAIPKWRTMLMVSHDGGQTFTAARELIPGDEGGRGPVRNKIIRLSDGTYAAPASNEDGEWTAFIDLTADGETYQACGRLRIFDGEARTKRGVIQPTLWESTPGCVHALLRSSEGFVYRSDSPDCGRTWSVPYPTLLPNNNSGIDLECLDDGRLVLACNPVGENWGERNPLSLLISKDNGTTWQHVLDLAHEAGKHEFSYPCIVRCGSRLHVTYTSDRVNIAYLCIETEGE